MHELEKKFKRLITEIKPEWKNYTQKNSFDDYILVGQVAIWAMISIYLHYYCMFDSNNDEFDKNFFFKYAALCFATSYHGFLMFVLNHEKLHKLMNIRNIFSEMVIYVSNVINTMATCGYFWYAHKAHHVNNAELSTLQDYLQHPCWTGGKDPDILFFGFNGQNPFKSDKISPAFIHGPLTYMMNCLPVFHMTDISLTIGEVFVGHHVHNKFEAFSILALRSYILAYMYYNHYVHFIMLTLFVVPYLHWSFGAYCIPLEHPETFATDPNGLRYKLEKIFGAVFPTHTPEIPFWMHQYMFFGLTYHMEHHTFTNVPWYNLHHIHRLGLEAVSIKLGHEE